MAISPEDTAELARSVARVYREAELAVLRIIARELGKGLDSPQWAQDKADAAGAIRRRAEQELAKALNQGQRQFAEAVSEAVDIGAEQAVDEAAALSGAAAEELRQQLNRDQLDQLAAASQDWETPPQRSVLRAVSDTYRQLTAELVGGNLSGAQTRRDTAQRVLNRATERGITGFTDRSGRRWEMASWAEMSTRSATARASIDAHTRSLGEFGHDLVMVSDHGQECRLCRPWEGEVLSASGNIAEGTHQLDSATGGPPVRVRVVGSLPDARTAGLMHPNCRHRVSAYIPGATKRPENTADPEGDRARQKLRYLERQVRAWKKREAAALDEAAATRARSKIRSYQAEIRSHVENTPAKRQRHRERFTAR